MGLFKLAAEFYFIFTAEKIRQPASWHPRTFYG
jgi:hypothetical protein